MANGGAFDWLGGMGNFISQDPDRFSILAGSLGAALGQGDPTLEALGQFGAGLGTTGKLDKQRQKTDDFWKQLLGKLSGPESPGLTGVKHTGKGLTIDMGPAVDAGGPNPDVTTPGFDLQGNASNITGREFAGGVSGTPGGGAATAPFPQAAPSASRNSSDIISALAGAYSGGTESLRWLPPEVALKVMAQQGQNRELANRFVSEQSRQAMKREEIAATERNAARTLVAKYGDNIPVSVDKNGIPHYDPSGSRSMTISELNSSNRGWESEVRQQQGEVAERTQEHIGNLGQNINDIYKKYNKVAEGSVIFSETQGPYTELKQAAIGGDVEAQDDLRQVRVMIERKRALSRKINKNDLPPGVYDALKNGEEITLIAPQSSDLKGVIEPIRTTLVMGKNGKIEVKRENDSLMVF